MVRLDAHIIDAPAGIVTVTTAGVCPYCPSHKTVVVVGGGWSGSRMDSAENQFSHLRVGLQLRHQHKASIAQKTGLRGHAGHPMPPAGQQPSVSPGKLQ